MKSGGIDKRMINVNRYCAETKEEREKRRRKRERERRREEAGEHTGMSESTKDPETEEHQMFALPLLNLPFTLSLFSYTCIALCSPFPLSRFSPPSLFLPNSCSKLFLSRFERETPSTIPALLRRNPRPSEKTRNPILIFQWGTFLPYFSEGWGFFFCH